MKALSNDLKHALRLYRRTPGASLMVVAVLAVGMAFVAAFLSLYSDLILRPEPGFERGGGRIVSVGWSDGRNAGGLPLDLIDRIAEETTTLQHLAGVMPQQFLIGTDGEQGFGELVTRDFFPGMRPRLALGRGFSEEEHNEEGEPVVVISWRYWQEQFGGRPDVLGQTMEIERQGSGLPGAQQNAGVDEQPRDFRIVGVMAREYTGSLAPASEAWVRFWMPVERGIPIAMPIPAQFRGQILRNLTVRGIARRAPGASNEAVKRELTGRFSDAEFMQRPGARYEVIDRLVQNVFIQRSTERQLRLFLGASVLLALVAAANVSLFLLARAPGRRRELGIRMAVGAPLKRLVRQLASEAAVLVLAGAALGLILSIWLAEYLRGLPFLRQAQWRDVTLLDWRVLALTGVFLLLVTLLVSLAPIFGLKRLGIAASSRLVTARPTIAQRVAGTAQVAIAGVLGGAAIAFTWYLMSMLLSDPGYRTQNLYVAQYQVSRDRPIRVMVQNGRTTIEGLVESEVQREAFAAVPGISRVSLAGSAPGVDVNTSTMTVADPNDPEQSIRVRSMQIDSNYIDMLGLRLVDGTGIAEGDTSGALVNQAFAQRFFGRDKVAGEPMPVLQWNMPLAAPPTKIVGVLEDLSYEHPLADIDPMVMSLSGGLPFGGVALVESTLPAAVLQKHLRDVIRDLKFTQNADVLPMAKARSAILAPDRARGLLTIGTAIIVVLLAAFGFYGTQRYLVTAGRREYAIRASLGAGPRALGRLVFMRGLLLGLPGLVLGAPLAFILVAWLRDDYISRDVSPLAVTVGVVAGLVLLLLVASVGPARMARRTQPAPLLRED
jgi:predicted permease